MYYTTDRNSETGKKVQSLIVKIREARKAISELGEELGFDKVRQAHFAAYGGISAIVFKKQPDPKVWKKVYDGWMPKLNCKQGKELAERIAACPVVGVEELNACVGANDLWPKQIGLSFCTDENDPAYLVFGFIVEKEHCVEMPSDCREILSTEFSDLFHY